MIRKPAHVALFLILVAASLPAGAQTAKTPLTVASPNGALVVTIGTEPHVAWSVTAARQAHPPSVAPGPLPGRRQGARRRTGGDRLDDAARRHGAAPVVRYKRAEIRDRFNERRIDFAGGYSLIVRAYDDGVAYRWVTALPGEITVKDEAVTFVFAGDHQLYFPEETSLISHQERAYKKLEDQRDEGRASSPACPRWPSVAGGPKVAITESDLFDYPGMDLTDGAASRTR